MAKTGLESALLPGQDSGTENEKYDWQVTISPYMFNPGNIDETSLTVALFKVKVVVSWDASKAKSRQIELTTIKLVNKTL